MKKETQEVQTVEQKQRLKESTKQISAQIEEVILELKFPNGCGLQFSSQANIKRIGTLVRELLCVWN